MVNKVVSNTGPILHLSEIGLLNALNVFSRILIPQEVLNELTKNRTPVPKRIKVIPLKPEWKDNVKIFTNQHDLDLGESQAIALALQEEADCFITDDLDARRVAKNYNLEVHGTVGIILRSFRENMIDRTTTIKKIQELRSKSTLFITSDLIEQVIKEINKFRV
jgi:predicted nucleic acid-binding protein